MVRLDVIPVYSDMPETLSDRHCEERSDEAIQKKNSNLDCFLNQVQDSSQNVESAITGYTVSVSDTGVGMSAEQIDKLFRLDSARSRKGTAGEQGSGLGLIVCRELLEKHGSDLHVESEEGKGSTFRFQLKNTLPPKNR